MSVVFYNLMPYPSSLKIGPNSYPVHYETVFKRTSSVRLKQGIVVLKLSRFVDSRQRDKIVEKFLNWAIKKLSKAGTHDFVNPAYKDFAVLCTHNKVYTLQISFSANLAKIRAKLGGGNVLDICFPQKFSNSNIDAKTRFLTEKLIMEDQKKYLHATIEELNKLYFCAQYKLCRFKRMNHRFGSCSSKGNINIAYRLLFAPREVFIYVCIHELAHLKEFNHSKDFWNLVKEAMPNYKNTERWLKNNGFLLG